ncbi:MAG TPA: hypothetical protein VNW68_05495 [Candidatus Limnocylindria bacterium]|nr:hypothetical protein [Candidatus Limnocylindria bacterium]
MSKTATDAKPSSERAEAVDADRRGASARLRFRTVNGSLYEIDYGAGTWRRLRRTARSGELGHEGGEFLAHEPLRLGRSGVLLVIPFELDEVRVLMTSPIVSIEPVRETQPD